MAAQRISGHSGSVKLGGTSVLGVRRWSATLSRDVADVTGLDSGGWRERHPTLKELKDIRIEAFADSAAGGWPPDIWTADTPISFELSTFTGGKKYTGNMLGTVTVTNAVEGVVEYTVAGDSTGTVTEAAAA